MYRYVDGREGRGGGGRCREGTDLGQFVLVLLRLASSYVEEDLHNGCLNSLIVVEGKQGTRGITDMHHPMKPYFQCMYVFMHVCTGLFPPSAGLQSLSFGCTSKGKEKRESGLDSEIIFHYTTLPRTYIH